MNNTIDQVRQHRPKMNYTGYSDKWTCVEIDDRFAGHWQIMSGPYFDWCDDNCTDCYNIVKYSHGTIYGRFRNPADAVMFKLKWS